MLGGYFIDWLRCHDFFCYESKKHWAFNQGERKTELKVSAMDGTWIRYNVPGRKFMYDDPD